MNKQALLISIDGVLAQCATAKQLYDAEGVSDLPIQAIYAAVTTLRMLVDGEPEEDEESSGECVHPESALNVTHMGGGHFVTVCNSCQEIVEQA
jgi:hypothetical protein